MYIEQRSSKGKRSQFKHKLLSLMFNTGIIRVGHQFWGNSLTVLNYHRIDDISRPGFDSFKPNVSATLEAFEHQMDYVGRWFNVICVDDLVRWADGLASLPRNAALITFDDGYLDNLLHAVPILNKHNFSAVIFLAAGHIESDTPFFWDLAAYCFHHTQHDRVSFPDGTTKFWKNTTERDKVLIFWIESLKVIPHEKRQGIVIKLPQELNVAIPHNYFRNLMMNWDQVRDLNSLGIEFGGHTITHPILTRITLDAAKNEIKGSKTIIENELGHHILSFAYPNGGINDFNQDIENITALSGYKVAFSLLNGPTTLKAVRRNPYAIRRIFISNKHTLPDFSFLVSPLNRYIP